MKSFLKSVPMLLNAKRRIYYYGTFFKNYIFVKWLKLDNKLIVRHRNGSLMVLPYKSIWTAEARQLNILSKGYLQQLISKYTTAGFVVDPEDIVIDCGAFVGGFSIASANLIGANRIFSVEPTPLSRECLRLNSAIYNVEDNITILPFGMGATNGELDLNLSTSSCDNSFLVPDAGATGEKISVKVVTFDQLIKDLNIEEDAKIFFKVEAEGMEPEIIKGIGLRKPQKLVIDVTPERDGVSPVDELVPMLEELGYQIIDINDRCLFAVFSS